MSLAQSKKLSQLSADNAEWEDRQLLRSGAVRGTELRTEFDDEDENRVILLVHGIIYSSTLIFLISMQISKEAKIQICEWWASRIRLFGITSFKLWETFNKIMEFTCGYFGLIYKNAPSTETPTSTSSFLHQILALRKWTFLPSLWPTNIVSNNTKCIQSSSLHVYEFSSYCKDNGT